MGNIHVLPVEKKSRSATRIITEATNRFVLDVMESNQRRVSKLHFSRRHEVTLEVGFLDVENTIPLSSDKRDMGDRTISENSNIAHSGMCCFL